MSGDATMSSQPKKIKEKNASTHWRSWITYKSRKPQEKSGGGGRVRSPFVTPSEPPRGRPQKRMGLKLENGGQGYKGLRVEFGLLRARRDEKNPYQKKKSGQEFLLNSSSS